MFGKLAYINISRHLVEDTKQVRMLELNRRRGTPCNKDMDVLKQEPVTLVNGLRHKIMVCLLAFILGCTAIYGILFNGFDIEIML